MMNNPGKVITRYQFCMLFGKAWMKSVIPTNIVSGFRITGIYPTNRYQVIPKCPSKPSSLCERTGLKFIPLFTPVHQLSPLHYSSRITVHKNQSSVSPMYSVHSRRIPIHDHEKMLMFPVSHYCLNWEIIHQWYLFRRTLSKSIPRVN